MTDEDTARLAFLEAQLAALKEAHYRLGDEFEDDAAYFKVAATNARVVAKQVAEQLGEAP